MGEATMTKRERAGRNKAARREVVRACVLSANSLGTVDSAVEAAVAPLCERLGYGAVMHAAARLWMRKDPVGALVIGPARIFAVQAGKGEEGTR